MIEAARPADEADRLAAVRAFGGLDLPEEERFDRITRVAADLFDVPVALVSIVDVNRQWFRSCLGLDFRETSRASSFCAHAILGEDTLVIEDATADERFHDNPLVVGPPYIRFYAGHPLRSPDGHNLGTLCLCAPEPRTFTGPQRARLSDLARWAEEQLGQLSVDETLSRLHASEKALRHSEQRLRAIFDDAGIGIGIIDAHGVIVDANAALANLWGWPLSDLRGLPLARVSPPEETESDADLLASLRDGRAERYRKEKRYIRRDGSEVWASLTVTALRSPGGQTTEYAIGLVEDITRRREAERLKEEFASVVGHELRTPLTSIRGSLGLLAGGVAGDLPPESGKLIDMAVSNAERLGRLVNDILDLERMSSGRSDLQLGAVPASTLVEEAVAVVRPLADAERITLRTDVGDTPVWADADRVVQALTNLLSNAVKFSPRDAEIALTVEPRRTDALFTVRDQGRGIPADQLEKVFERFRQVDSSDAREKGGTGLGLAISRGIVEHHGGRIWAESELGEGTAFHFTLPLAAGVPLLVCGGVSADVDRLAELVVQLGHVPIPAYGIDAARIALEDRRPAAVVVALDDGAAALLSGLRAPSREAGAPIIVFGLDAASVEHDAIDARVEHHHGREGLLAELLRVVPALQPGTVLVVERDPALGGALVQALHGDTLLVSTAEEAIASIDEEPPSIVVLDLVLPGSGESVIDHLRERDLLSSTPVVIYSALELTSADLERLDLGPSEVLAKVDNDPADVGRSVARLLTSVVEPA